MYIFDGVFKNPGDMHSFSRKPQDCETVREYFESREGWSGSIREFSGLADYICFIIEYCRLANAKIVEFETKEGVSEFFYSEYFYFSQREWYYVPVTSETSLIHRCCGDGRSALLSIVDRLNELEDSKYLSIRELAAIIFDDEIAGSEFREIACWVTPKHRANYRTPEERLISRIAFATDCLNDPSFPRALLGCL